MMLQIRDWLTSPTFLEDEEKTIRARLLHTTLLSVMGFLAAVIAGGWLSDRIPATALGIDIVAAVVCFLFYYWMRQGKVRLVSIGLVTLGVITITLAVASLGTIRTPTTATYLTLVIVAGLLFDLRGIIVMTILSSLAILGLIAAENAGLLPAPDLSVTLTQWITYTALFGASSGLTIMVLRATRQALGRAQSEIAERARVETQLRASEARYRSLFESSDDAILLTAPDGIIFAANPAACRMFGRTETEISRLGRAGVLDLTDPRLPIALEERKNTGHFRGELRFLHRDGQPFSGEMTSVVFQGEDGQPRTSMIIRDITARKQMENALRESEDYLRRAEQIAHVGYWSRDVASGEILWSDETCRIFGLELQVNLNLTTLPEHIHPEDRQMVSWAIQDAVAGIRPYDLEYRALRPDGTVRWIHSKGEVSLGEDGQPGRMFGTVLDITERKQTEEALKESEEKWRSLVSTTPDYIALIDPQGKYLFLNHYAEGFSEKEVIGSSVFEYLLPESRDLYKRKLDECLASGRTQRFEFIAMGDHGIFKTYEQHFVPVTNKKKETNVMAVARDITERKRAEQQLAEYTAQLRALSQQLAEAQENERREMARELHDRVGQNLSALGINLNIIRSQLPKTEATKLETRLDDSLQLVQETMERVRDVMGDLRPAVLDDYGLLAALQWYGDRFAKRTGIAAQIQGDEPTPRLSPKVETALFRIAQEALTNIAKHARAQNATLSLEPLDDGTRLTIADDGAGFDSAQYAEVGASRGWGMLTMRERAESIGGELRVETTPGKGTRVVVEIERGA